MRKEMDKAGVKDPQVLDKSYWIQRVGEVWGVMPLKSELVCLFQLVKSNFGLLW